MILSAAFWKPSVVSASARVVSDLSLVSANAFNSVRHISAVAGAQPVSYW
jgi:hypothetical protein